MGWSTFDNTGAELQRSFSDTPIGSLIGYAGASAPTGWLICDGSAVNRTTYADLFSVIGTTYGTGNGTTTFNLPDAFGFIIYAQSISERIATATAPQYVTSLPTSPVDGQTVVYAADASNGVMWTLRYRAASSSSYKWEFVGGSFLASGNPAGDITTASSTDVNLTGGPTITAPLAGEYVSRVNLIVVGTSGIVGVSFYVGTTWKTGFAASVTNQYDYFNQRNVFFSSGDVINIKVNNANSVSTRFVNAVIGLCPVRVG